MAASERTYETDYRIITVKTIDGSSIQGKVNIAPNQRVSDLLTLQKGPFLVIVEASFAESSGKTLLINKDHIVWVEPED